MLSTVARSSLLNGLKSLRHLGPASAHTRSYQMSVIPYWVREMIRDLERPTLYDQHFGQVMDPARLLEQSFFTPSLSGYTRPWRSLNQLDSGISQIINDKDCFKVSLDVQQFKPEELTVKVVDDYVIIEGKHEERSDEHGLVSRQFTRRYLLPDDIDKEALQSSLSSDGVLQFFAPKKAIEEGKNARKIPITHTNAPAVKAADSSASAAASTQQQQEQQQEGKEKM